VIPQLSHILAQHQLPESVSAIRDRFQRSTPISTVLIDVLILLICLALPSLILVILRKISRRAEPNNPHRLYADLLRRLPLSSTERNMLEQIAGSLRLPHPTVLLLSPTALTTYASAYSQTNSSNAIDEGTLVSIRNKLFPSG
jgi:hypothetical protein